MTVQPFRMRKSLSVQKIKEASNQLGHLTEKAPGFRNDSDDYEMMYGHVHGYLERPLVVEVGWWIPDKIAVVYLGTGDKQFRRIQRLPSFKAWADKVSRMRGFRTGMRGKFKGYATEEAKTLGKEIAGIYGKEMRKVANMFPKGTTVRFTLEAEDTVRFDMVSEG